MTARRYRLRGDRGTATVEVTIYTPVLLALVPLGVQVAVWGMAWLGADYTASHAAQTTRVYGGTVADGQAAAAGILDSAVGQRLYDPQVSITRSATTVTVTVRGTAASLIPGWAPPVTATVVVPVERLN